MLGIGQRAENYLDTTTNYPGAWFADLGLNPSVR
jgi:hypothetical protein